MSRAVIVQARMTSARFPGKSMADLNGKPVIQHVLERCLKIGAEIVMLAVPDAPESEPMADIAIALNCDVHFGSEHDVLRRYAEAMAISNANVIMRITGDCPLIDPSICRKVLFNCTQFPLDYISNIWPKRTFPKGHDCEAFTRKALLMADQRATDSYDREHVTPWMQRQPWARPGLTQEKDESDINLCIDTEQDLDRLTGMIS